MSAPSAQLNPGPEAVQAEQAACLTRQANMLLWMRLVVVGRREDPFGALQPAPPARVVLVMLKATVPRLHGGPLRGAGPLARAPLKRRAEPALRLRTARLALPAPAPCSAARSGRQGRLPAPLE